MDDNKNVNSNYVSTTIKAQKISRERGLNEISRAKGNLEVRLNMQPKTSRLEAVYGHHQPFPRPRDVSGNPSLPCDEYCPCENQYFPHLKDERIKNLNMNDCVCDACLLFLPLLPALICLKSILHQNIFFGQN